MALEVYIGEVSEAGNDVMDTGALVLAHFKDTSPGPDVHGRMYSGTHHREGIADVPAQQLGTNGTGKVWKSPWC
jgi:hypothetical protein